MAGELATISLSKNPNLAFSSSNFRTPTALRCSSSTVKACSGDDVWADPSRSKRAAAGGAAWLAGIRHSDSSWWAKLPFFHMQRYKML